MDLIDQHDMIHVDNDFRAVVPNNGDEVTVDIFDNALKAVIAVIFVIKGEDISFFDHKFYAND